MTKTLKSFIFSVNLRVTLKKEKTNEKVESDDDLEA